MFDDYEKQMWEKFTHERFLAADALSRCDDGLGEESLDRDQWGYGYVQLSRAIDQLNQCKEIIAKVRFRRLQNEVDKRNNLSRD